MDAALLDTDILSEVFKARNDTVSFHVQSYLAIHGQLAFSAITRFEVERGLKLVGAQIQTQRFQTIVSNSLLFAVTDSILDLAAELWVEGIKRGLKPGDADLFIAATAIQQQRVLVTGNTTHFAWIPNLRMTNWRDP